MGQPEQNTNNQNEIGGLFLWQQTVGDNSRVGAVRGRSQVYNPTTGLWTKRDAQTGKFMDVKTSSNTPFKGVRKEK